jgi:hypothetical protein
MMKNLNHVFRISLVVVLIAGICGSAYAQKYPVQVNTQLMPPFTPYLSDYTAVGSQQLMANFLVRDLTLPEYRCKLRITIEGVGITIRTKQNYIPRQPLVLPGGGIPYQVYGDEMEEYFHPDNLDFAGITRTQFAKSAKLPAGVYRFSIEALDYNRGTVVSNRGTATAWIVLNDPPILNLPRIDTKVRILDPTNIPFSWTPRHTGSPNAAFTTEYIFRLVEIWPAGRNPYDAFLSQQPLYETTTANTQIIYGMAEPALIPGRKYAWQVQAIDVEGRDLFKNLGKSEVFVFQFGDVLGAPENLRKEGSNASVINVRWDPAQTGATPQQYRLRYRAKKAADKSAWFENTTDQPFATLTALKAETEYELQVRAEAAPQYSDYSALYTARTEIATTATYACGTDGAVPDVDNSTVLPILRVNDVVTLRNFQVTVTEVEGSNGDFTGKGWMKMPWFNGGSVLVEFNGHLNDKYQLVTGEFKSVYNKGSAAAQAIEDAHKIGEEPKPVASDSSATDQPPAYTVDGTIDSVYVNDEGKIVVVDTDGKESTLEPRTDASGNPQETVVSDSAGNSYTVDQDGKVTKNEGAEAGTPGGGNAGGKKTKRDLLREIVSRQLTEIKQETQK